MAVLNTRPTGGAAWGFCRGRAALAATSCGRRQHREDATASLYPPRTASWNFRVQEVMTAHTRHSIWSTC
uniref:Uncharacterized protein n=1 Tax=Hyaloperonospora arabidopsidis (strain Emoy2) TaxID=559515 RepID=M4BY04_HYAAE